MELHPDPEELANISLSKYRPWNIPKQRDRSAGWIETRPTLWRFVVYLTVLMCRRPGSPE